MDINNNQNREIQNHDEENQNTFRPDSDKSNFTVSALPSDDVVVNNNDPDTFEEAVYSTYETEDNDSENGIYSISRKQSEYEAPASEPVSDFPPFNDSSENYNATNTQSTYTPNWQFSENNHTPRTDDAGIIVKNTSPKKTLLVTILINALISLLICAISLGIFSAINRPNISEDGSLIIFKDGDDLRQKVDISETLSNMASDGETPLTTQDIAMKVGPAVVGIVSTGETATGWFNFTTPYESSGSGVIISEDGYIVTNNHVIDNADKISVILNTNEEYAATVVGTDARTDLAVIKIEAKGLTWATLGNSGNVKVGEPVVAIGNPLGMELAGTVTKGIISATNRSIEVDGQSFVLLQTDAAINSGNSGGALVNAYGEVIGINSAKLQATGVEGLSFAIPSDVAKPIVEDLIKVGFVQGRPLIGIIGDNITAEEAKYYGLEEGILVMSVSDNSAAKKSGILRGDLIIECQGKKVKTVEELNEIRDQHKAGDEIKLTVIRNDEKLTIPLVLGEEASPVQ